jgi:hypothetical protein
LHLKTTNNKMKSLALIIGATIVAIICVSVIRSCGNTAYTVHKEFSASALLKKYEYFKDLSAAIDSKRADLNAYKTNLQDYTIKDKDDKFYYEQSKAEAMGILMMHNQLVSEYNAGMSKFNYAFCNVGTLPASNLEPLPREFKPYLLTLK